LIWVNVDLWTIGYGKNPMHKPISAASTTLVAGMCRQLIGTAADDEQGEVITFLRNPTSYGVGVERVEVACPTKRLGRYRGKLSARDGGRADFACV
jgi:hypothetical protein